jgi:hypothetical protein
MKKLYLSIFAIALTATSLQAQFTNLWKKMANGVDYSWFSSSTNANNVASLAYNPATDKLLVSNRNSQVYIINAATGAQEGTLNLTGLGSESFKFNKIRVTDDGVIYGISLVTGAGQCKIYRWDNQTAVPSLCADFTVTERCGDAFGLAGTGTNTVLYASGSGTTANAFNIYILNTTNGSNFSVESKVTMTSSPTTNQQWANRTVEPETVGLNSAIWIKGGGYNARKISVGANVGGVRSGTVVTTIADGTASGQASLNYGGMKLVTLSTGLKYLGFAGGNTAATGTTMRLLNVTDEANITTYGTDVLVDAASYSTNSNGTGDVAYKNNNDASYTVFSLSTNNGIWASKSGFTLPVELTAFTAALKKDGVQLNWTTATEITNKGFDVERSLNGTTFSAIAFVRSKAEGASNAAIQYTFVDNRAVKGTVYYRLKQIDNDGRSRYSPIEKVFVAANEGFSIASLGNPVKESIRLQVNNTSERTVQLQVTTSTGAVVYNRQVKLAAGEVNITVPVSGAATGLLFVTVSDKENKQVLRIVKQ